MGWGEGGLPSGSDRGRHSWDSLTRVTSTSAIAVVLGSSVPGTLLAQRPGDAVVVVVTVSAPTGAPIGDVDVFISRSSVGAILIRRTNEAGLATFVVQRSSQPHAVLTRKVGWTPKEQAFEFGASDSIQVRLQLEPATTQLPAVVVEAKPSDFLVTASEMAASPRPVRDALEAMAKLRPYMLYDRARCPGQPPDNVWINGRRVLFMASNTPVPGATRRVGSMTVTTPGRGRHGSPPALDSLLASIRVGHVHDIQLVNCWDISLPGVGANNALYVTLKPGFDWDWRRGSFAADSLLGIRR
jgi:hypothetical protein